MTTRRGILKLVGGGVVLAALGGAAFYLANGPSDEARAAWREAGAPAESAPAPKKPAAVIDEIVTLDGQAVLAIAVNDDAPIEL